MNLPVYFVQIGRDNSSGGMNNGPAKICVVYRAKYAPAAITLVDIVCQVPVSSSPCEVAQMPTRLRKVKNTKTQNQMDCINELSKAATTSPRTFGISHIRRVEEQRRRSQHQRGT